MVGSENNKMSSMYDASVVLEVSRSLDFASFWSSLVLINDTEGLGIKIGGDSLHAISIGVPGY